MGLCGHPRATNQEPIMRLFWLSTACLLAAISLLGLGSVAFVTDLPSF
jgi:hypothetical protein